jgi:lipopolysaccharide heptosyltransferase I
MTLIELPNPPQRILLIKPSALGDIVHTLPVLNLLRRRWPAARISWLIGSAFADLVRGHPQLDELITFDRKRFARGWHSPRAVVELITFLRSLGKQQFDLVIDLQGLLRSGTLTALTRAPVRVGFSNARELAHLFYTHHVPVHTMEQHAIERYLNVTEALGCGRGPVEFHFHSNEHDRARVGGLLDGIDRFAVLLPGTNWMTKRWPAENFAALVRPLREQFGMTTVIAGGPDVAEIASRIDGAVNLVGKTNLRELVVLLERASLVIANDSGPMHIAAALGKPLVTMFGPTNPIRTGPYQRLDSVVRVDIPCSPCYSRKCSHVSCMRWIGVEHVIGRATSQMTNDQTRMTKE